MYLVHPTPPLRVFVDNDFLYGVGNVPKHEDVVTPGILISVKARLGYDLEFQVLLENGALRDKLPISALGMNPDFTWWTTFHGQSDLQRWCCPANHLTVTQLPLVSGKAWIGNARIPFSYLFTVDMVHCGPELDLGDSHVAEEHKSMHIIELDEMGLIAAMPNNSLVFDHPTLIPENKQLTKNPGYVVASNFPCSEAFKLAKPSISKDQQFYDATEDTENE
jgi:hypothetical protein